MRRIKKKQFRFYNLETKTKYQIELKNFTDKVENLEVENKDLGDELEKLTSEFQMSLEDALEKELQTIQTQVVAHKSITKALKDLYKKIDQDIQKITLKFTESH